MLGLFLSRNELVELTGFKASHCQARWLDRNRWRYVLNAHGEPRVARAHFDDRMGCINKSSTYASAINDAAAIAQPNFAALDRR